jgi:hypothetical protein
LHHTNQNKQIGMTKFKTISAVAKEKQNAREFVNSYYNGEKTLSLSADNFIFESMLLNKVNKGQIIDCYEYNKKDYLKGKKTFKEIKIRNNNVSYILDNIFNADFTKYDFIFLDLCQNLSVATINNILSALPNFNGKIFITIQRTREKFLDKHFNAYGGVKQYKHIECAEERLKARKRYFRDVTFIQIIEKYTNLKLLAPYFDYQNTSIKNGKKVMGTPMRIYPFGKK